MNNKIKVILADDHQSILKSITYLLRTAQNIEVVATAENGEKAMAMAQSMHPDVLILDVDMPKLNGLQVSARMKALDMDVKIIIFSIYDEAPIVRAAFHQGVQGYVLKSRATTDLIKAVQTVTEGEVFISEPIARHVEKLN